jgi:hypothetical protein
MTAIWPVALTVAFAGLALLIHPVGPFGGFWRPSDICPDPTIIQLPFFAGLALTEATSFGLGFAFLAFGYPYVRSVFSKYKAVSVWLAIAWLFINWFPHNALHMNAGIDMWRTIVIDFTFHVTLIVAGCFTAYAFVSRPLQECRAIDNFSESPTTIIGELRAEKSRKVDLRHGKRGIGAESTPAPAVPVAE